MKLIEFLNKLVEEKERQPEIALILKMSLLLLTIMVAKILLDRYFLALLFSFVFYYFLYQLFKGMSSDTGVMSFLVQNFTFIFSPYVEGKDRYREAPIGTYVLILVTVFVFYIFTTDDSIDFINQNLLFLPYSPNPINVPISLITHIFLHADASHLWGNMIFLWAIGTVIERRIGCRRFLYCYFITGVCATLISTFINFICFDVIHSLGASGAISGLMGVYLIRCYFKTMAIPIPLIGFLPINIKIRMNSFVAMSLFFLLNLGRGFDQMLGISNNNINYWAHIVGFTVGIFLAKRMQLIDQAVEERHLELGIKTWNNGIWNERALEQGLTIAHGIKSLNIALEKNQCNPEILLHLARLKSQLKATEEGKHYYNQAIQLIAKSNPQEAIEVFREYSKKYYYWNLKLAPAIQYQLAELLYKEGDLNLSERLMEMIVGNASTTVELKEKAMFQSVKMLAEMNLPEATKGMLHKFANTFPQSQRLNQLKSIISTV